MRWVKDKDRPTWRLRGKGLRRGRGPVIGTFMSGPGVPGVWDACTDELGGTGFRSPESLRKHIELLEEIERKWLRLMEEYPEVKVCE